MVRINKIYTKTGDKGETMLADCSSISKASPILSAIGLIDSLNVALGHSVLAAKEMNTRPSQQAQLVYLQNRLFDLGAELAQATQVEKITAADTTLLENWIDEITKEIPPLTSFVLPGGNKFSLALHTARCQCRQAELACWQINKEYKISAELLIFLNRMSDYFFALSRLACHEADESELLWQPGLKFQIDDDL